MRTTTLLGQFLAEECTTYERDLIRGALEAAAAGTGPRIKRFEFNRFEATFDLDQGEVVIEDVLDASETGIQRVPVGEFLEALSMQPI